MGGGVLPKEEAEGGKRLLLREVVNLVRDDIVDVHVSLMSCSCSCWLVLLMVFHTAQQQAGTEEQHGIHICLSPFSGFWRQDKGIYSTMLVVFRRT